MTPEFGFDWKSSDSSDTAPKYWFTTVAPPILTVS